MQPVRPFETSGSTAMNPSHRPPRRAASAARTTTRTTTRSVPRRVVATACCPLAALLLASCASPPPAQRFRPEPSASTSATGAGSNTGITYWSEGQESLQLDACLPPKGAGTPSPAALPAVVIAHGGGFTSGGRDEPGVRALCTEVAATGSAAFAISYRLAPQHVYPAQVDDMAHAVEWLRQSAQVQRFGLDPARVGVIGSSAGAIMAQSLATRGEGPLDQGSRVKAVVSLSGVSDMGPEGLKLGTPTRAAADLVLGYLGCSAITDCPQAQAASPISAVDPTDPPVLLVNGSDELVPRQQAEAMGEALRKAGVAEQVVIRPGSAHGLALLDPDVRRDVKTFLEEHL